MASQTNATTVTSLAPDALAALQSSTTFIRNVCVLAHVDHGKTTLTDHLISSNGLVHPRLAGELRYMDSLEDEQMRGITMKASSISLLHTMDSYQYLFNLIDSPGHVDFCSEVSAGVRLSDGGFVLVDAVEGVCIQTHAVLRQAWEGGLGMCLVVNKVDRLVGEMGMGCGEAYQRIVSIIQNVNMVVSSFESERWLSEADAFIEYSECVEARGEKAAEAEGRAEAEEDYFNPVKGNVAFGSAYDGWAFTIQQFAAFYAEKLGCKPEPLTKALWGSYMYSAKSKRIMAIKRGEASKNQQPLFVSWILEPIWKAYECVDVQYRSTHSDQPHREVLAGLCDKLKLGDGVRKAVQHADARVALRGLMRGWLPLSEAVLGMGARFLPDPRSAAAVRVGRLLPALVDDKSRDDLHGHNAEFGDHIDQPNQSDRNAINARILDAITSCDTSASAPLVIYVSKMVSVPTTSLPRSSLGNSTQCLSYDSKDETFLAFGRVFSGQMRRGQTVHVIHADGSSATATIPDIYLMMGRGLESLEVVPAGNVLAMRGLETAILKSATISSSPACRPFLPLQFQAAPIVQVAVEPAHPGDMEALERGLQLLHRADPLVNVSLQESGEHVVSAAGEIHLETCIKDLKERFARIELVVSPPLVRFKESLVGGSPGASGATNAPFSCNGAGSGDAPAGSLSTTKVIEMQTPGKGCRLRVKVTALADKVASEIEGLEDVELKLKSTYDELQVCFEECMRAEDAGKIWQLGPKRRGPNMLLASSGCDSSDEWNRGSEVGDFHPTTIGSDAFNGDQTNANGENPTTKITEVSIPLGSPEISALVGIPGVDPLTNDNVTFDENPTAVTTAILAARGLDPTPALVESTISAIRSTVSGISTGFQLATASGPLCGEPLRGVLVSIDSRLRFATDTTTSPHTTTILTNEDVFGPFNGQVTATARQAIHKAILENGPRIVEAYFLCEISTSSEGLSAVYAVLGRRRARILREELKEGSGLFVVMAHLPVEASFGFADELRRKSSGSAAASLLFSHWERLDVDPFFIPLTEEEREEFGEEGQGVGKANLAKTLIDGVLRRKGKYERKLVEDPTKQRTRARKV